MDTTPVSKAPEPSASTLSWLKTLPGKLAAVRPPRRLKVIENLPLGEKRFLALVEVGGRTLLLGSTPTTISLIERLDTAPAAPQAEGGAPSLPHAC